MKKLLSTHGYLSLLILMLFGIHQVVAQNTSSLGITFGNETYTITFAEKYSASQSGFEELAFFQKHFATESYTEYRNFYYNNTCLASADEFFVWHQNLVGKIITPEALYRIHSSKDTLSIIAASITTGASKQFFPMALQRRDQRWYLLDLAKSQSLLNVKMFMAFVNPDFLHQFLEESQAMKDQYLTTLYTANGNLNGDLLMNFYQDRYDPKAKYYTMAKTTFHDIGEITKETADQIVIQIQRLVTEYHLSPEKQIILENMSRAGNYNMAISKIAEWSNTFDVVEITDKFYTRMKESANSH